MFIDEKPYYEPRPSAPLAILLVAGLIALAGCAALDAALQAVTQMPVPPESAVEDEASPAEEDGANPADGVDFSQLDWCYGSFNGSNAACVENAKIGGLSISSSGLRYEWISGGCETIDAANTHENANCIAALFVRGADDAWRGGKFDWISSDRLTRDFKNIVSGYNGWDPAAVRSAQEFAFVIVSKDGRRRTNVAVQEGAVQ